MPKSLFKDQRIAIPNREGYEFVPVSEIIYCKANGAYTDIILANNKHLLLSKSLGKLKKYFLLNCLSGYIIRL
ncbi:MAG: hypothetical protein WKG06_31655 [Segetibacter sp.]